jgi:hypothetical protein
LADQPFAGCLIGPFQLDPTHPAFSDAGEATHFALNALFAATFGRLKVYEAKDRVVNFD